MTSKYIIAYREKSIEVMDTYIHTLIIYDYHYPTEADIEKNVKYKHGSEFVKNLEIIAISELR